MPLLSETRLIFCPIIRPSIVAQSFLRMVWVSPREVFARVFIQGTNLGLADRIMYDIDLASAVAEIKRLKARIVALQVPEGLKKRAYQIAEDIENKAGAEVMLVAEPCFGACDVPSSLFELVDAVVNVGHSPIPSLTFSKPVIFVPARANVPVMNQLK